MHNFGNALLYLLLVVVVFAPTIIASSRHLPNATLIFVLNILGITWPVALVMSCWPRRNAAVSR